MFLLRDSRKNTSNPFFGIHFQVGILTWQNAFLTWQNRYGPEAGIFPICYRLWKARSPTSGGVRICCLVFFEALDQYCRLRCLFLQNDRLQLRNRTKRPDEFRDFGDVSGTSVYQVVKHRVL